MIMSVEPSFLEEFNVHSAPQNQDDMSLPFDVLFVNFLFGKSITMIMAKDQTTRAISYAS